MSLQTLGVVGAGQMGNGIAHVAAVAGYEVVLTDIEQAHPEIRQITTGLDVARWGHAMIRPRPGFVWGQSREDARRPVQGVHFANTDLSGVELFEEAFYHGNRAGEEVLAGLSIPFESIL